MSSTTTASSEDSACTAAKQICIDVDDSFDDSSTKEDFLD